MTYRHNDDNADNSDQNENAKRCFMLAMKLIPVSMIRNTSITCHRPDQLSYSKEGVAKWSKLSDKKNHKEKCSQGGIISSTHKENCNSTCRCWILQFLQILDWKENSDGYNKSLNNTTSHSNHQADRTTGAGITSTFSDLSAIFISNLSMCDLLAMCKWNMYRWNTYQTPSCLKHAKQKSDALVLIASRVLEHSKYPFSWRMCRCHCWHDHYDKNSAYADPVD